MDTPPPYESVASPVDHDDSYSEILEAICAGNAVITKLLGHGTNPNARDSKGRTLLHRAAKAGNAFAIKELLAHGANPDARDHEFNTPYITAVLHKHYFVLKLFIDHESR